MFFIRGEIFAMEKYGYRFSFGPWNIHEGADPFGPAVRPTVSFDQKLEATNDLVLTPCSSTTTTRSRTWTIRNLTR